MKLLLFLFAFPIFMATNPTNANFKSDIFSYDVKGKLSVRLAGTASKKKRDEGQWQAVEMETTHIPFHQGLFGNKQVMAAFAGGEVRTPESVDARIQSIWIPRFKAGHPNGGLTVFFTPVTDYDTVVEKATAGHVVAGLGDEAGASEIAYSYMPKFWRKGIGSSVLDSIVRVWAPEVRRIGLGLGLDEEDAHIMKKFQCFGGQTLERLDATASPSNPGSWILLDREGFKAAKARVESPEDPLVDFQDKGEESSIEESLLKLYDATHSDSPLAPGVRYCIVDEAGQLRTVSKHVKYKSMKYHFEYQLAPTQKDEVDE